MAYKDHKKQLDSQKKHYRDNSETYKIRRKCRKKERIEYTQTIRLEVGCQVCGYRKCAQSLTFHHLNQNKDDSIIDLARRGFNYERLNEEIRKCIILCHNCHNEHHNGIINADNLVSKINECSTYKTWEQDKYKKATSTRKYTKKNTVD